MPHLGDCMQAGQPSSQGHSWSTCSVARHSSSIIWYPLLRDANASRVAIVDEDLRPARVRVKRRGHTADVVAVAEGEQRQYAYGGVLGGVKPSR